MREVRLDVAAKEARDHSENLRKQGVSQSLLEDETPNPTRQKARYAVHTALRAGDITKPKQCQGCGEIKRLQIHHTHGYSEENWLKVIFVCHECHKGIHKHTPNRARGAGWRTPIIEVEGEALFQRATDWYRCLYCGYEWPAWPPVGWLPTFCKNPRCKRVGWDRGQLNDRRSFPCES